MKYLKTYESISISDKIKELFYDLTDNGIDIDIDEPRGWSLDFPEKTNVLIRKTGTSILTGPDVAYAMTDLQRIGYQLIGFNVEIIDSNVKIKWKDIKENLLFAESYIKGELGFNLNHILYTNSVSDMCYYYKSINDVPDETKLKYNVTRLAFRGIKE